VQYLTADESRAWAIRRGYHVNEAFGLPLASEVQAPIRFDIPEDAGARVVLARTLWEAAGQGASEVLVWVTDWGVWPSGEHPPLAEAARRGFGAERPMHETPGHLARPGEDDAGLGVLCMAVLFLWDCWVLPADERPAVFVSHDELGVVDPRGDDRGLRQRLEALGFARDRATAIQAG
jgi:hypothetical protein